MKFKMLLNEQNTIRFYRELFVNEFSVIPDGITQDEVISCGTNQSFNDFTYEFKGMTEKSETLNKVISKCHDKFADFLHDSLDREMRLQLESHSYEIKDLLIQALFEEEKHQKSMTFSLLDGNSDIRALTEMEKRDLTMLAARIKQKPHLKALYDKCEEITVKFIKYNHKVKKRKLKGKKPK
ncbi:hypothetical protein J7911_22675 [Vibrio parahaemolyticus]|uniref:hypothetical protein n=1 Tax=Vibrio parahaemolyticus TaxID=670 RepID=UPI00084AA139|nr:hypothetical protein [Vibrio parahaemolyticus]MBM5391753.1 hypothetical protein [Vibrio parahaemolyticus]MBM5409322.1 hypothetical protein [Vibrio parahaemolyticus]MCF9670769.1 hypothetical protein [Vibrio parahaemolyticus]MCF9764021.1 hypothetical protein [Vibrio parahaemolyticus]MCF9813650.1 hypothetical protein [Vibrio parahaemolyticus]